MQTALTVAIVDDHLFIRDIVRKICTEILGFEVIAEAANGRKAVEVINGAKPKMVVIDIVLPGIDGFEVVKRIKNREGYQPKVLLISGFLDAFIVHQIANAKIDGFVDKRVIVVEKLCEAISEVALGRTYFSETFRKMQAEQYHDRRAFHRILTAQERTVLELIGDLLPDEKIATRLKISGRTLETHRSAIKRKLRLRSRPELIQYAQANGLSRSGRL